MNMHSVRCVPGVKPRRGGGGSSRGSRAAKLLTSRISAADTPQMLLQLVQEQGAGMDHIHASALFTRAKELCDRNLQEPVVQQLLQELERLAERVQQQCGARQLANIMWACGYLQLPRTVELLLPWLLQPQQLQQANPQNVANTLWGAATLGLQLQPEQLQPLLAALVRQLPRAKPQEISNSLWACAELQYYPQQLLAGLRDQGQSGLQQLLSGAPLINIASIAYDCARLGCHDAVPLAALLQQAVGRIQQGAVGAENAWGLANLCWAAAVLDLQQSVAHVLQLAAACGTLWRSMVAEEKQQLYQVHLWLLDTTTTQPQGLSSLLTVLQLQECRWEWEQSLERDTQQGQASQLQQQVFAAVQRLPPDTWQQQPVMEQLTSDRAFSIDIAAVTARGGKQLAIEVDGPWHFLWPGNRLDGPTQARNRALTARGWTVASVPYWEWDRLRNQQQQGAYLLRQLQQAAVL